MDNGTIEPNACMHTAAARPKNQVIAIDTRSDYGLHENGTGNDHRYQAARLEKLANDLPALFLRVRQKMRNIGQRQIEQRRQRGSVAVAM